MDRSFEVAIGLGGTYLFLSIIVLAIVEGISGFFNRRGMLLKKTLEGMLTGEVAAKLVAHPLVTTLAQAGDKRKKVKFPSYLGPTMFSQAMTEVIAETTAAKQQIGVAYQTFLGAIENENHRKHIQKIVGDTVESVEQLQHRLETWFNNSMDRLSGAYKRKTQWISRGFAAGLVIALNVNTIVMAKTLWTNPELRAAAVKKAQSIVDQCDTAEKLAQPRQPAQPPADPMPGQPPAQPPGQPLPDVTGAPVGSGGGTASADPTDTGPETTTQPTPQEPQAGRCPDLMKEVDERIPVPISGRFWNGMGSLVGFVTAVLGLLLSIWAVSLGAPFWFDTLRKLSGGIQQTGPKPKRDEKK